MNCEMHEIWNILRDVCLVAHRKLLIHKYLHEDAPFIIYATDGRQTCWMSHLSFCFDFGGDFPNDKTTEILFKSSPIPLKDPSPGGVNRVWFGFVPWEDLTPKVKVYMVDYRPDQFLEACWTCCNPKCPNAPAQRS